VTCEKCRAEVDRLYFRGKGLWFCKRCFGSASEKHVYTGRKFWTGEEVYGKKLGSDELRADTEAAMLGGSGKGLKG
jgi:hypothetical protein